MKGFPPFGFCMGAIWQTDDPVKAITGIDRATQRRGWTIILACCKASTNRPACSSLVINPRISLLSDKASRRPVCLVPIVPWPRRTVPPLIPRLRASLSHLLPKPRSRMIVRNNQRAPGGHISITLDSSFFQGLAPIEETEKLQ